MKDILDALGINLYAVVIQAVSLIILVVLVKQLFFQKILGVLDDRRSMVTRELDQMQADRQAMQAARVDYEQRLTNIEAEARERIQAAIKEAQQLREQIMSDARSQGEALIQRANGEIVREKQKAMAELRAEVAELAVGAAAKILGRTIDPQAQRDLIGSVIQDVGRGASPGGQA
jgi:F-type H+-transporting ATPase subunit b